MLIIGLTGGIGTGKSTAARYFIDKGFAHIDADLIAHEITAEGMPMVDTLNEYFGPGGPYGKPGVEILQAPGVLDRKAVANIAFNDDDILEKFNEIMHTAIIEEIERRIDECETKAKASAAAGDKPCPGIIIDAPLLFESGANELCDIVILITADMEERITRVCLRDNATRKEIKSRIDNQMDDEVKIKLADFVVDNSGSHEELYKALSDIPISEFGTEY